MIRKVLVLSLVILGSLTFSFCVNAKELQIEKNVLPDKVWNIKFNTKIDLKTLDGNIIVTDGDGKLVKNNLSISKDLKNVMIIPVRQYALSGTYTIVINKNIRSLNGNLMPESVIKKFSIMGNEDLIANEYISNKKYKIIKYCGKVDEYTLNNRIIVNMPYAMYWSVQNIDAKKYIGKDIKVYKFIVNNHVLDNIQYNKNKSTLIYLMISEGNVVGGYSIPNCDRPELGWVYSIDGKTLEDVTGMSYSNWLDSWNKKYK